MDSRQAAAPERASGDPSSEEWMARAVAFELLAMGLLVPKPELAGALASGEYAQASAEAADMCGLRLGEAQRNLAAYEGVKVEELFHELRREHTRLFAQVPEPRIVPYVGVWVDRTVGKRGILFLGERTLTIERFMRRCGVAKDVSALQGNDPVDHVGSVCEFLEYLCLVNAHALKPSESAAVRESDFSDFLREHFSPYARWCAARMREEELGPYYRFAACLLESLADLPA